MPRAYSLTRRLLPIAILVAVVRCGSDSGVTTPSEGLPAAIDKLAGDNQSGVVGQPLPVMLTVRVTDSKDRPVQSQKVAFVFVSGGTSAQLIPDTAITDADGQAQSQWGLGSLAGQQRVEARVVGSSSGLKATFSASALADAPDAITAVKGTGQSGVVGSLLADSLAVLITDQFGNPIVGRAVAWSVPAGQGSVSATNTVTGADGRVAVTRILGPAAGTQTTTATATGVPGSPVTFTHTATSNTAVRIVKLWGDNATAPVGSRLTDSLVVQVQDAAGNGVPGRNVNWVVSAGGGSVQPLSSTTDVSGKAFTVWTLGTTAGTHTVTAAVPGLQQVQFTATATSAQPTQIAAQSPTAQNGTAGLAVGSPPAVRVADANNNPVAGVTVTFQVTAGGGTVANTGGSGPSVSVATGANGVATLTSWTLGPVAGSNSLTATATGSGITGNPVIFGATGQPGTPSKLSFMQQPANVIAGQTMSPVTVAVQDANGNLVTSATNSVTLSLSGGTAGAVLGGTKTVAASAGIATFSTLSVDLAGTGYSLIANASSLTGATSGTFSVTTGSGTKLAFQVQPAGAVAGVVITPAVLVVVQDAQGNTVSSSTAPVSVALTTPNGATLSGTTTQTASGGVATFSNLSVNLAGSYTLTATSPGLTTAGSASFSITPAGASQLVFTTQPINAVAGSAMGPVKVSIQDPFGNTVTSATTTVTVAIGTNPGGGVLSGTTSVAAVAGVATFSNLVIDKAGTGYTLTANGGGLPQVTSTAFDVQVGSGNKLVFLVQPSNTSVGSAIAPAMQVAVQDAQGNLITTSTDSIRVSLSPPGALGGTVGVRAVNGIATFSNVIVTNVGSYTLTALAPVASPALIPATSASFTVSLASTSTTITGDTPDPSITGQPYSVSFSVTSAGGVPTGTVTVSDATDSCIGALAGGSGSCILTSTTAGSKNLTATYGATTNFGGSVSSAVVHTVNKANTSLNITGDALDPSVTGEAITVTWAGSVQGPGFGTPTGNVTVSDGTGASCVAPFAVGSCTLTPATAGSKTLAASYAGDVNFIGSGDTDGHTVNKASTTTGITQVTPNPASYGQVVTVTYSATVNFPGSGTPTGTVTVSDGATPVCSATVATGVCSFTPAGTGTRALSANYAGDANYSASSISGTSLTVNRAATGTLVASSHNPSVFGQAVNFTATVTSVAGAPTGSVQFVVDGVNFGGPVALNGSGVATSGTTTGLAVGSHTVAANYAGDANFAPSSGSLAGDQTVTGAPTSTAVASSDNPSVFGQAVSFTATVTSLAGTPTGSVQFVVDGANLGGPVALNGSGVATSGTTSVLIAGSHTVVANYTGDASFAPSSGSLAGGQMVTGAPTTTAVASSDNPSVFGQGVNFTATVSSGAGIPTGSVQFLLDGVNFGAPVALNGGGVATSATTAALIGGSHTVVANYSGGASFSASSGSLAGGQTVSTASTGTAVASSDNPSVFGQAVSFTATVTSVAGNPTGSVQFVVDGSNLGGPVALNGSGVATSTTTTTLAAGNHTVAANYGGDVNFSASTGSLAGGQTVGTTSSATAVASSVNPSTFGQGVSFTATVTSGAGTPTGSVQFVVDGVDFGGPVTLNGSGVATSATTTTLTVGSHTVVADYGGDANHTASSGSLAGGQTVTGAPTNTTVASSVNPSVLGQGVNFSATVTSGAGTPTGSVQFVVDGVDFGGPVALNGSGVATSGTTAALAVGNHTVTANYGGAATFAASSGSLAGDQTVDPFGAPDHLAFGIQPTDSRVNRNITPNPTVQILDAFGNLVATATNQVTMSIANDPVGGSKLGGNTTHNANAGTASFGGMDIDQVGNGFTLQAISAGLPSPSVISNSFDITP